MQRLSYAKEAIFPEKEDERHYCLEFMLTLDKMQNISTLMPKSMHSSVYRVF